MPQMSESFTFLRGTSATGKGTRVAQLLLFLLDNYSYLWHSKEVMFVNSERKPSRPMRIPLCIEFPELGIKVFGKWARTNRKPYLYSWSCTDYWNTHMALDQIMEMMDTGQGSHSVFEGYPLTLRKPWHLESFYERGFRNFFIKYFIYPPGNKHSEGFKLMLERVKERTGRDIKGSCWSHNQSFITEYKTNLKFSRTINGTTACELMLTDYREEVWKFGAQFLGFLGHKEIVLDFVKHSRDKPAFRKYDQVEENHRLFEHRFLEQPTHIAL